MLLPLRLDLKSKNFQVSRKSIGTNYPNLLVPKANLKNKFENQQRHDLEIITNQFLMKNKKYIESLQTTNIYGINKKPVFNSNSRIDLKI
ncbi:MAG: hypothetical protein K0S51_895 [Bacillales bacterium]|jgi:hypothetical protein|nr:hypothetical protein [Bacillales bacterium]